MEDLEVGGVILVQLQRQMGDVAVVEYTAIIETITVISVLSIYSHLLEVE